MKARAGCRLLIVAAALGLGACDSEPPLDDSRCATHVIRLPNPDGTWREHYLYAGREADRGTLERAERTGLGHLRQLTEDERWLRCPGGTDSTADGE